MWSLGVTLVALYSDEMPFPAQTTDELHTIMSQGIPCLPEIPSSCPAEIRYLIWRCCQPDINERMSTKELLVLLGSYHLAQGDTEDLLHDVDDDEIAALEDELRGFRLGDQYQSDVVDEEYSSTSDEGNTDLQSSDCKENARNYSLPFQRRTVSEIGILD
jgi:hypothetical protein